MRAVSYRGPSRLRVVDKPEPRIEDPGDAVVRVTRTAICGSDLHLYHGYVPDTRVDSTFGHEFTGVVTEVGFAVEHLAPRRPRRRAVQHRLRPLLLLRARALRGV
jgi:threonine dehydrogenase-like Zn-dependent dehydrogenase